jgi:hypothetical protein
LGNLKIKQIDEQKREIRKLEDNLSRNYGKSSEKYEK